MNNLSMKTKLFVLILSVIMVFLIAMSLIRGKTSEIADEFSQFYNENYSVALDIERIKARQVDIVLNVRGLQIAYLLSLDKQVPGYISTISTSYSETPQLLNKLESEFVGDAQVINRLSTLVNDFQTKTKVFVSTMETAPDNKAPFPVFSAFITSYGELIKYITELTNEANEQANLAQQHGQNLIDDVNRDFWISIILVLIISLGLGFWISNNIVARIHSLRDAAKQMAEGYLNKPVKDVEGSDELADLANSINSTTQNLRNVMSDVLGSVDQINKNSSNVLEANQSIGRVSLDVTDNTSQIVVALEQMSSTNKGISDSTQHSVNAANDIREVAKESLSTADVTLSAINELVSSLKETGDVVAKLRDETSNIEKILDVIRGISEQTNLLALNAAIEAARAGEQGRGFAVVADEVRGLAQRSQDSVNEIETLLSQLSGASTQAVERMGVSIGMVESSRGQVERTNELTNAIMQQIDQITEQAQSIVESAEEQNSVSEDITKKMYYVQELTEKSSALANDAGSEMATTSTDVKQRLSFFKV